MPGEFVEPPSHNSIAAPVHVCVFVGGGGGGIPYISHLGMCGPRRYGF